MSKKHSKSFSMGRPGWMRPHEGSSAETDGSSSDDPHKPIMRRFHRAGNRKKPPPIVITDSSFEPPLIQVDDRNVDDRSVEGADGGDGSGADGGSGPNDLHTWSSRFKKIMSPTLPVPKGVVAHDSDGTLGPSRSLLERLGRSKSTAVPPRISISTADDEPQSAHSNITGGLFAGSAAGSGSSLAGTDSASLKSEISDCLELALGDNQESTGAWMPAEKANGSELRRRRKPPPEKAAGKSAEDLTGDSPAKISPAKKSPAKAAADGVSVSTGTESWPDLEAQTHELIPLQDMGRPAVPGAAGGSAGSVSSGNSSGGGFLRRISTVHRAAGDQPVTSAIKDALTKISRNVNAGEDADQTEKRRSMIVDPSDEEEGDLLGQGENIGDVLRRQQRKRESQDLEKILGSAGGAAGGADLPGAGAAGADSSADRTDSEDGIFARAGIMDLPSGKVHGERIPPRRPPPALYGKSLGIFPPSSLLRMRCYRIAQSPALNNCMTVILVIQTGLLSYQEWSVSRQYMRLGRYRWVDWVLFLFYVVYTGEMAVKSIAWGFWDDSQMFQALHVERERSALYRYYERVKAGVRRRKHKKPRESPRENHGEYREAPESHRENHKYRERHGRYRDVDPGAKEATGDPDPFTAPDPFAAQNPFATPDLTPEPSSGSKPGADFTASSTPSPDLTASSTRSSSPPAPPGLGTRAYLRADWNKVDFISIVSFWVSFVLSMSRVDYDRQITVFRSLMCLKIMRLMNFTQGTRICLKGVREAAAQCKEVVLFLVCFWVLFGIIGVQSFKTSLRRHCVWQNPGDPGDTYVRDLQFCGSYVDATTREIVPYLDADGAPAANAKGFSCPVYSRCILGDNPYGGTVSFDNIFHSLEMVFVVMSANTFTDIMYYTMDSENLAASIFYVVCIFFLTVWLINLIIAVIINSYRAHMELLETEGHGVISGLEKVLRDCRAKYRRFTAGSKAITRFAGFSSIFVILIAVDFVFACYRRASDPVGAFDRYYRVEFVVSVVLAAEIVARFLLFVPGGHARVFFYSPCNWIDLVLAAATLAIILPPVYSRLGTAYGWLSFFQVARFYRVVMSVEFLRQAWMIVFSKIKPFLHLCGFFALSLYLIGIVLARMFETVIPPDQYLSSNQLIMENLPNVIISLYTITSTENWTTVLYLGQQCARNDFTKFFVAVSLIAWFVYSNTILINIFIAIITDNIGLPDAQKKREQIRQFYVKLKRETSQHVQNVSILDSFKSRLRTSKDESKTASADQLIQKMKVLMKRENISEGSDESTSLIAALVEWLHEMFRFVPFYGQLESLARDIARALKRLVRRLRHRSAPAANPSGSATSKSGSRAGAKTSKSGNRNPSPTDRSLFVFANDNRFRVFCQRLVAPGRGVRRHGTQPIPIFRDIFSVVMFVASVAVIVIACYTTPLYRKRMGYYTNVYNWTFFLDVFFTALFTAEFVIKIVADGFVFGECAYIRSAWNAIDFVVLISFWITVFATLFDDYTVLTIIGALRAMRGFRLLTITRRSQDAFQYAVLSGARQVLVAAIIALSLLLPFALWGLNLFRGRLGTCLDGNSDRAHCTLEFTNQVYEWNVVSPNVFQSPPLNFDRFRESFFSLFQIVSLEGWVDLLLNLMNITGPATSASTFASPGNAVYIAVFNFLSIVLILNVFVSMIISNYSRQTGVAYLSEQQLAWYEVKKILSQVKPSKRIDSSHMSRVRRRLYRDFTTKRASISRSTDVLLFVHLLGLLSEAYPMSDGGNAFRYAMFMISTSGLLILNLLRLYAYGTRLYFANRWNSFRIVVSVGAFVMSLVSYFVPRTTVFANFSKLFLVAVLLFLIPKVDVLNQLLKYASASLPSLLSIIYTWVVLFLVFAMALNQVFGLTRTGAHTTGNLNARTVPKALVMLFRASFGEGWNYIMDDFAVEAPACYSGHIYNSDCGRDSLAYLLFVCWNILSMYIFMNILISVVVNNFSYVYHESGPHTAITREELRKFKRAWNLYDPLGSGYIDPDDFQAFLDSLDGVLSYRVYPGENRVPQLTGEWISRGPGAGPYDLQLDFGRLHRALARINFKKARERRARYDRLIIEAKLKAVTVDNHLVLRFNDVLAEVGYYSRFKDSTCLTLEDFIQRTILMKKINKILRNMKIQATVEMTIARLKFKCHILRPAEQAQSAGFDPWTADDLARRSRKRDKASRLNVVTEDVYTDSDVYSSSSNSDGANPFE